MHRRSKDDRFDPEQVEGHHEMHYCWKDYRLDPKGMLLTRSGSQIEISRKALDCITRLIEQRHRVVAYDELILCIWGHGDVGNDQLTKIVVAARRAVGDDGHAQQVIRTVSGLGYRWVQPLEILSETARDAERSATAATAVTLVVRDEADAEAPMHLPDAGVRSVERVRPRMASLAGLLVLLAALGYRQVATERDQGASLPPPRATTVSVEMLPQAALPETVEGLREAMRMGRHQQVEIGLSRLPAQLRDTPDARMLQIELEIERGAFDAAERRLVVELEKARSADDPLWQSKLLTLQSESRADAALGASEVLPPARSAVALLESAGESATSVTMGRALSARGNGFLIKNDLQAAIADLARARDILQRVGDEWHAAKAKRYLAHVWLREGRMTDALEQMAEAADILGRLEDPVNEIAVRNMATRIQIEQLRWAEALQSSERSLYLSEKLSGTRRSVGALQIRGFVLTHVGRLREAGNFYEEVEAIGGQPSYSFRAAHALWSGRLDDALAEAALGFDRYGPESKLNLNLESRDGALLLWVIAAQGIAERGAPMPVPTAAQRAALENAETDISRIAYGRWLASQGRIDDAEAQLRLALVQPRATGRLLEILYANEALIELQLARGDTASARRELTEMWGRDPDRFANDYRANLLALRVALAAGDDAGVTTAYRQVTALAGERALPIEVVQAYAQRASGARSSTGSRMVSVEYAP